MNMITGSGSTAIQQRFSYDASGNLVAVVYKVGSGTSYIYYYLRNAQGDIVKLDLDLDGLLLVTAEEVIALIVYSLLMRELA